MPACFLWPHALIDVVFPASNVDQQNILESMHFASCAITIIIIIIIIIIMFFFIIKNDQSSI